jgi:hypothetical protein
MKRATPILFLLLVSCLLPMSVLAQSPGHGNPEISQMPGFPIEIGPHQPLMFSRGAVLADLDGDGDLELIYVHNTCASGDPLCGVGQVEAWDHNGNALPGFPVTIVANEDHPPSIGDLDGDGDQEIVVMTTEEMFEYSLIYVIDRHGVVLDGYPLRLYQSYCFTTLFDLDLDGKKEIIFGNMNGLQVIGTDGVLWDDGWPVNLLEVTDDWVSPLGGALSVGDVDNDGQPEIAAATARHSVVLVSANGEIEDGWPRFFPTISGSNDTYSLLGDVDGDSDLEVIVVRNIDDEHKVEVHVLHHDGEPLAGWPRQVIPDSGHYSVSAPIVVDLDGDGGGLDVVVSVSGNPRATTGGNANGTKIFALDSSGEPKRGFPYRARPSYQTGAVKIITAVDIDGDGAMELFADAAHSTEADDGIDYGFLYGIDSKGKDLPGFPLRPAGSTNPNGAIFGDVDNDGDYEMAVLGMSFLGPDSPMLRLYLYDFQSSYSTKQMTWPTYHAANDRSGLFKRRYKDWRFVQAGTRIGGGR